jgi:NAD(P)-dependent dehydrogenase (short-subunit alcohol dehydrogenase family)
MRTGWLPNLASNTRLVQWDIVCRAHLQGQYSGVPLAEVGVAKFSGLDLFRLDGRVAVITGGGGAIGTAMAGGLISAGAAIAIVDRRLDAAEATVRALRDAGGEATAIDADVTSEADVKRAVQSAAEHWGRLDILINGAGIGARHPAEGYPLERWQNVLDVNLTGTFLFCREAGQVMLDAGRGSIINIASIAGLVGYNGNPAYLASKGGVVQLTRALAIEWATRGVRVNAIAPGVISTPMVSSQIELEPDFYVAFRQKHPVDRFGTTDELVGPALFLASDAASFVTGQILAVDGGYLAQ